MYIPASAPGAILPDTDGDTDVVLLSTDGSQAPPPMKALLSLLTKCPSLASYHVWLVTANVSIIKMQRNQESVDLLWLAGCRWDRAMMTEEEDEWPDAARVRMFAADDPNVQLPPMDVAESDCIRLSRLFMTTMKNSNTSFTVQSLTTVRQWAKARHVYGTQFGYPGGCAWASMLWAYTQWLDNKCMDDDVMSMSEVVRCFFVVLAIWPWPLPFSSHNMFAVVASTYLEGRALQGSVGRHQTTAFVVSQPCGRQGWNMTRLGGL